MSEQSDEIQRRARQFALDVIALVRTLPDTEPAASIKRQLTRAGAMAGTARSNEQRRRRI